MKRKPHKAVIYLSVFLAFMAFCGMLSKAFEHPSEAVEALSAGLIAVLMFTAIAFIRGKNGG